ncbi:MAG TPA: hypothetical protein VN759_04195 [Pseudolysinimonas sp.]|nr:hypothetical protein [Pseudolysinimonas sp.]
MTTAHDEALDDDEQLVKDRSDSPSSERETAARQADPAHSAATDDIGTDDADVRLLPGTGGPDDDGEVHVDPDELHVPRDTGAH